LFLTVKPCLSTLEGNKSPLIPLYERGKQVKGKRRLSVKEANIVLLVKGKQKRILNA
jgi:hypothetical protein